MNCSNMSPSHRLQFFINCSSAGPFHGVQSSRNRLHHRGRPWAARGQPASPCSSPCTAGESVFRRLEHLLPTLLHWPECLQSCFSHIFSLLSPPATFSPLLKHIIAEALPLLLIGLALASGESILELVGIGFIRRRGHFWQLLTEPTPVSLPTTKTLPCKTSTPSQIQTSDLASDPYSNFKFLYETCWAPGAFIGNKRE